MTPYYHDTVTYNLTITNNGNTDFTDVLTVTDSLPEGLKYIPTATIAGADLINEKVNGQVITWTITNITAKSSAIITVKVYVNTLEESTNNLTITGPNGTNKTVNCTIDPVPLADLEVIKLVSNASAHKGYLLNWTIIVINHGPNDAENVVVTDDIPDELNVTNIYGLPEGTTYENGIWTIGDLPNGTELRLVIETKVLISNKTIINVVNVTSDTHDPNLENNNDTNQTVIPPEADLEIIKLVSNATAHKGDIVNWYIIAINNGPDVAINARVSDILPDGVSFTGIYNATKGTYENGIWTVGDLAANKYATLRIETIVTKTNMTIINMANGTSDTYDPDLENNNDTNQTAIPPEADLEVIKQVSKDYAYFGEIVDWVIIVTNNGPDAAINVKVSDKLPSELLFVSADGDYSNGVWNVGDLAKGESRNLTIKTLVVTNNATIVNIAIGSSDTYDPDESNNEGRNTTEVPPKADLEVIKLVSNATSCKGDLINWTIVIKNNGPNAALNAYVIDELPAGLVYVSDDSNGAYNPETGIWRIGNLSNGESRILVIETLVNVTNVTIENVAVGTSDTYDPNKTNNNGTNKTNVLSEADLEVIKQVSATTAGKGDLVNWTIIVINNGPDKAINAIVTDKLPNGLVYITDDSKGAYDPQTGIWTIGNIAKGETKTLIIQTLVNVTNTTIENIAVGTSDTPDPDESNNNGTNKTNVLPEADLEVTKTVPDTMYYINDTVIWTVALINNGPDGAVDAFVSEKLPDGLEMIDYTATKGTYENGIWTVGYMANGEKVVLTITTKVTISNANITNVAVANSSTYDPDYSNNNDSAIAEVYPCIDLELAKIANIDKVTVGDKVIWTIIVKNNGLDKALNSRVTDVLPNGLKYISYIASKGQFNPETGIWTIGDLEGGESVNITITTEALIAGVIINEADVISDTYEKDLSNNHAEANVTVEETPAPEPTPEPTPIPVVAKMLPTGNPIVMALLAVLLIVGTRLRKRK